jgi:hypothetical protein
VVENLRGTLGSLVKTVKSQFQRQPSAQAVTKVVSFVEKHAKLVQVMLFKEYLNGF